MLKRILNLILDLFFPKKCLGCGCPDTYLCQTCFNKIEIVSNDQKQKPAPLARLIWAVPYSNPLVKNLIRIFKYQHIKELAKPLAQLQITSLARYGISYFSHDTVVIVPVPLHKRKLRERDFNQAELLAEEVGKNFSLPLETKILIRTKYTLQQARIKNDAERKETLKNAFEIAPEFVKKCVGKKQNLLKDKTIILIDDVSTTGTTLSEAAKILKRAGAKEVWGLVIAKG